MIDITYCNIWSVTLDVEMDSAFLLYDEHSYEGYNKYADLIDDVIHVEKN